MLEFMLYISEAYGISQERVLFIGLFAMAAVLTAFSLFCYFCAGAGMELYRLVVKCVRAIRSKLSHNGRAGE